MKEIKVRELLKLNDIKLIDIREQQEVNIGMIPDSIHVPMMDLLEKPESYLDKNKCYYIICRSGRRSAQTVKELERLGYQPINVKGGYLKYLKEIKK